MLWTIPTLMTLTRIVAIPFILLVFYMPISMEMKNLCATIMFIVFALTDWLDWMAQIGASRSVAVHMLGKLKTTAQMVAIPFLFFDGQLFGLIDTALWGLVLIWIAGVLTVWSMVYYLRKAWPDILKHAQ